MTKHHENWQNKAKTIVTENWKYIGTEDGL